MFSIPEESQFQSAMSWLTTQPTPIPKDKRDHTSVTLRIEFAEIFFSPDLRDRIEASRINLIVDGQSVVSRRP